MFSPDTLTRRDRTANQGVLSTAVMGTNTLIFEPLNFLSKISKLPQNRAWLAKSQKLENLFWQNVENF